MSRVLRTLEPHASRRLSEAVAGDPDAIDLTVGYPWFGPPAELRERLREVLAEAEPGARLACDLYAPGRGTEELREAIARLYGEEGEVDPEREVLVTNGAAGALAAALLAMTEPGDEVLLPDPCYTLYEPLVRCLGRDARRVATSEGTGFALSPEALTESAGPRSRAVIVNSPGNPTGSLHTESRLRSLAEAAASAGLVVLSDEVMDCFAGTAHVSLRSIAREDSVVVNSLSKRFGMTGWRVGWLVAVPDVVEQATKAQTFTTLAVSHPVQVAAAAALGADGGAIELTAHANAIRANGRWLAEALAAPGMPALRTTSSGAGFYHWLDVSEADREWALGGAGTAGERVAQHLLERQRVAVVPGIAFGPAGADFVRVSFAGPRSALKAAVDRISSAAPARS
jgi:aspartate/methionine/tyrosine aminotransferase